MAFDEAVRAGYKIKPPHYPTNQVKGLRHSLGDEYHLARLHCWNIAHRVIGDGWSEAVYPTAPGRDYYVAELWDGYCSDCVARVHGIDYKDIKRVLNLLERKYIERDPVFNDAYATVYGAADVSDDDIPCEPAMGMNPAWTLSVPGYQA